MNSFPVNFYIRHAWVRAWAFVWEGAGALFRENGHKLLIEDVGLTSAVTLDKPILVFRWGNSSNLLAGTLHLGPEFFGLSLKLSLTAFLIKSLCADLIGY